MTTSPREQAQWLRSSVGVYPIDDHLVNLVGEDSASWISGQVTANLKELEDGLPRYALAVTVKGRVLSDLWVLKRGEDFSIVVPERTRDKLLSSMDKHIIMEDVELQPDPSLCLVTVQGPLALRLRDVLAGSVTYPCKRLVHFEGFDAWVPRESLEKVVAELTQQAEALGGGRIDDAGWAEAHVTLGIPRAGVDFDDGCYPQEAGLKTRAVAFDKGCYLGQEVVYMLENRGQLSRRLVQLSGQGATPAAAAQVVDATGARIGEVTSVAPSSSDAAVMCLAYVKRAHAEVGQHVRIAESDFEVSAVIGLTNESCPLVAS